MDMVLCEFCNDFVKYDIKIEKKKENIDGIEVVYNKKRTYCKECKQEIFVNKILDENVLELQRVYRNKIGIITVQEIEKIVDMYGVGKRNLSKLLGFGELTLTRYLDLDMPTKVYSDVLFKVLDYKEMLIIAKFNKDKVTEKTYEKLLENIKIISQSENENKLIAVSKYIVAKTGDITNLAVQKLLYFCQLVSYAIYERPMFTDTCQAWKYGPVYTPIYHRLHKYSYDCINSDEFNEFDEVILDDKDKEIVDSVLKNFGKLSGTALKQISHLTEPWLKARKGISETENSNAVISNKSIKEYSLALNAGNDIDEFCLRYMIELLKRDKK